MAKKILLNISAKDLAKLKKVTPKAIYKAVKSGRLQPIDPKGRPLMFERARAITEWEDFRKSEHMPKIFRDERDEDDDGDEVQAEGFDSEDEITDSTAGRRRRVAEAKHQEFKAENERLKYLELLGKLVDVDKVQKEAFELARITRDSFLAIPDRLSAQLCGVTDQATMHSLLTKEINGALNQLVKKNAAA